LLNSLTKASGELRDTKAQGQGLNSATAASVECGELSVVR
jgi:hypothetical protein